MRIARSSDLVALVPCSCLGNALAQDRATQSGLMGFELPDRTAEIVMSALWHPRVDADPAHRRLRETITASCRLACP